MHASLLFLVYELWNSQTGEEHVARRKITLSRKGPRSRITALGGPSFGFQSAEDVIGDIQEGLHTYFVREGPFETELKVVEDEGEPELISTGDVLSRNNLRNLPGC